MSHAYHHPIQTPKRSLPTDFPPSNLQEKVIILAKVNMIVTIVPVVCSTFLILLLYFRLDLVQEFAKNHNQTLLGGPLLEFTSKQQAEARWQTVLLQFSSGVGEAILGYVLYYGSRKRDYGYMKAWLLIMTLGFLVEISVQGMFLTSSSHSTPPILVLILFILTDFYRFTCLCVVYLLIDEMLERGEVKRDRGKDYEMEE